MNSLSWMIYFADVSGGISRMMIVGASLSSITAAGYSASWLCMASGPTLYRSDDRNAKLASHEALRGTLKSAINPAFITAVACSLIATLIPSKNTVYAIAASQAGDQLAHTETATKAMKALDAWLDKQAK